MNDLNPVGAGVPPLNKPPLITQPPPLGDDPEESKPIPSALVAVEAILRQPRRVMFQLRQPQSGKLIFSMLFVAVICAIIYGLVMGTFSKENQLWAVPLKVAIGMLISGLICLPSLYIFSCLSGSKARLSEIFGLLSAWMGALHLIFWMIATGFGLRFLAAGFSHSQARSSAGLLTWIVIFLLVTMQMTAALRPLVGTASTLLPTEKKFFLVHWGEHLNASKPD
jgi:hypothetical protein